MFSITTMESSTTRPMATVRALNVSRFRVRPWICMSRKAISTEAGMLTAVMMVARHERRNSRMTRMASRAPRMASRSTPVRDFSMNDACSKATLNSTPDRALLSFASSSSLSSTAFTTVTVLAARSLATTMPMDGRPWLRLMVDASSCSTSTSATSPTVITCTWAKGAARRGPVADLASGVAARGPVRRSIRRCRTSSVWRMMNGSGRAETVSSGRASSWASVRSVTSSGRVSRARRRMSGVMSSGRSAPSRRHEGGRVVPSATGIRSMVPGSSVSLLRSLAERMASGSLPKRRARLSSVSPSDTATSRVSAPAARCAGGGGRGGRRGGTGAGGRAIRAGCCATAGGAASAA